MTLQTKITQLEQLVRLKNPPKREPDAVLKVLHLILHGDDPRYASTFSKVSHAEFEFWIKKVNKNKTPGSKEWHEGQRFIKSLIQTFDKHKFWSN